MTHDYILTRDYGCGITRSMTLGGQASLDEIIDAFRAMLVLMGYHTSVAERLVLVDADESERVLVPLGDGD